MNGKSLRERRQEFENEKETILHNGEIIINNTRVIANESSRVANVARNSDKIITELDAEFEKQTGLTKTDIIFLFSAIGLQIARQYLMTNFKERKNDQEEANKYKKEKEHSDRHHKYYNPSFEEIKSNPVPFDALNGADGALSGGGKFKHRGATLGHDMVIGLIVGTANIATSTLTTNTLKSYHITTKNKKDFFKSRASTVMIFEKVGEKLTKQGVEGWKKVAMSLLKEIQHILTDIDSKDSLPLPFLTLIDGALDTHIASDLANYGLDMANLKTIGKQTSISIFINSIIAMLHRLMYKGTTEEEKELYEVRTRKILKYSNLVAASSNVAVVALTKKFNYLDVGGIGVAIYRLITDSNFIYGVKHEFVFGGFHDMITGEELELQVIE